MLKTYTKFILLLWIALPLMSCSLFEAQKTGQTVSVDDLLKEDIEKSKTDLKNNDNYSDTLYDEEELAIDDNKNNNTEELTLDDGDNLSDNKSSDNEELTLDDDTPAADLKDNNQLSLEDEEEPNIADVQDQDNKTDSQQLFDTNDKAGSKTFLQNIKYSQSKSLETIFIEAENKIDYESIFNKKNNQLIIEINNAVLSKKLKRSSFVNEISGDSIVAVHSYQESPSSVIKIVLQLKSGTYQTPQIVNKNSTLKISYNLSPEYLAKKSKNNIDDYQGQNDTNFKNGQASKDNKKRTLVDFFLGGGSYYGKPISLQFEDVSVRKVIAYISSEVGANILVDDKVSGKISLKLRNIPWDQALALVLKSKGLGYIQEKGGILRISSLNNLKKEEEALVAILKSKEDLTPLSVKILPISFASASKLSAKIKVFLTPKRGAISSDERSNTLIITDTPDVLKKISKLVKNLDKAPSQVSIEAKFIEASKSFSKNLGVNWGFSGGKIDINGLQGVNGPVSVGLGAGGIRPVPPETLQGLSGSLALTLGSFKFLGDLSSILAIAEQDQIVKVISTPTVVVLDKQKASITNKGENVSISRTSEGDKISEKIERTPIILQLDVAPQIAANGSVLLDVNIKRDFAGGAISASSNAKPINSRSVKSKVLIKNGDTLVIGGIFQKDVARGSSGVPFLSKLPLFGWLFKYQSEEESKNELMVFLTPTIL
ncbi:MAG: type IV pilus secretin PilQ [Bdellovibrionales bacterium]|nr:type IV pilus secretin PilQ [Bdellovibrionales bacterium]